MTGHTFFERSSQLVGNRVLLRPMRSDDAEYCVAWRSDPSNYRWFFSQKTTTMQEHLAWFHGPRSDRADYVIVLKETNRPIGTVNFTSIDLQARTADCGKLLGDKAEREKGLAKEAFHLWLAYGFEQLGLKSIYARTFTANTINIALNKKLGFCVVQTDSLKQPKTGISEPYCVMLLTADTFPFENVEKL